MSTTMDIHEHLAAEIRRRRESKRLTPEEAASKGGVSAIAWRKWESGERWPGPDSLASIARVLGCRPASLLP